MREVLIQLRIPVEMYDRVRLKTQRLMKAHEEDMDNLVKLIEQGGTEKQLEKLNDRYTDLHARGIRITNHNVVRQAIDLGLDEMRDPQEALDVIAKDGVAIGRPRRVAG
jgi:hypothetical protein